MTADSQEQKDLELLRKKDNWLMGEGPELTKEEVERVSQLESEGLTEYQKRQREWDDEKNIFRRIQIRIKKKFWWKMLLSEELNWSV